METNENIEQRLAALEKEVADLKSNANGGLANSRKSNCVDEISGSMKDFPEWSEVCRTGKKIANAQIDYADTDATSVCETE